MPRGLRLLVRTARILTGMAATIAAGPGRAGHSQGGRFRSGHNLDPGPAADSCRHHGAILGSLADSRPQGRTAETIVNLVTPITVRPSALT